ncbi:MAG TPA: tetratricopeptide repeat protein [Candidatus Polarisedimenticolia bacterium]|nr:tetratricopeptide repeat protein [Candidatus Polarisedimenticolia bacterium]
MGHARRPANDPFSRAMARGYSLLKEGNIHEALAGFREAFDLARAQGHAERTNKATASISACLIDLGDYEAASRGLREIILRSTDDETICAASYNLSISLRRQGKYQKAFSYAQRAFERSRALGDANWMARCHNLIGNIHLVQCHLDKALVQYRKALALRLKEKVLNKFSVAILKDNIGYCMLLKGDYDQGIASVREALDLVTELGSKKCICECSHDLSFGYMQLRRLDEAERYGLRALEIAEAEGYKEIVKNCFYLLGEINYLKGDEQMRDHYFYRLQELYPHLPFLRDFLCTFDVSKIIALRFPQ